MNDVRMCPRSEMWKPVTPLTMQSAMTDIQEAKQASRSECQLPYSLQSWLLLPWKTHCPSKLWRFV